jgi:transposase
MAEEDIIRMSIEESSRLHIIRQALEKSITQKKAAQLLALCERQVRRIVLRIRQEGDGGICHRARGRVSNRRINQKVKKRILTLCRGRYREHGPTLIHEKLSLEHQLQIGIETLRQWFIEAGIPYQKRRNRPHRHWRERKSYCGEMVQMDGSHHAWLEDRGPRCVLMGYIDDATNETFFRFYGYEGTMPAMDSFKRYIRRYGVPQSLYVDKHAAYKSKAVETVEDDLLGRKHRSNFEKSLERLEVMVIHAHSPQAKGRIERLFRTLQDRLVKELRVRNINTIEQANEFLTEYVPQFNKRFRRKPAQEGNLHRPALTSRELDEILSVKTERALRNDFTVAHNKKLYQVHDTVRAKKIVVQERIDGSLYFLHQGRRLRYTEITTRPVKEAKPPRSIHRARWSWTPPVTHPWKRTYKQKQASLRRTAQVP